MLASKLLFSESKWFSIREKKRTGHLTCVYHIVYEWFFFHRFFCCFICLFVWRLPPMFFFFFSVFIFEWTTFWIACPFIDKLKTTNFCRFAFNRSKIRRNIKCPNLWSGQYERKFNQKIFSRPKNKWQTGFNLKNLFIAFWLSGAFQQQKKTDFWFVSKLSLKHIFTQLKEKMG